MITLNLVAVTESAVSVPSALLAVVVDAVAHAPEVLVDGRRLLGGLLPNDLGDPPALRVLADSFLMSRADSPPERLAKRARSGCESCLA